MTWLPPVKWCTVHVCLHTEDVNMTLNIADQYRRRIHTLLIMSAVVLISLLLPSVVAQVDSGVTLETVDMNWHQWPLFHSDHELTELLIPHPSGILLSEHSINGTAIRVGRLGHSAVSIRQEWSDIHGTNGPVLDRESCEDVITRTEEYVAVHGWTTHRHAQYPTTDVPLEMVFPSTENSATRKAIDSALQSIFKQFSDKFDLKQDRIRADDLFIAKYDATAPGRQVHLEPHQDKQMLSFVLALNENFTDGGTYFFSAEELWRASPGAAVLFHGMHWHSGHHISSGVRYIIAGFCDYGDGSVEQFMDLYRPQNDGFAAGAGFRNNDIIRGLEECTLILKNDHSSSSSSNRASNTEGDVLVHRRLVNVDGISGERWRLVASSCEQFAPSTPLRMIVERRR